VQSVKSVVCFTAALSIAAETEEDWQMSQRSSYMLAKRLLISALALAIGAHAAVAIAQRPRLLAPRDGGPRLRQPPQEELIAAAGSPFGVGKLTMMLPRGVAIAAEPGDEYTLAEKNGRALYQAYQQAPVRGLLREILDRPQAITVYFLFKGDGPLELTLYTPEGVERQITPQNDANLHARLLGEWWREYSARSRPILDLIGQYSPIPLQTSKSDEYPHSVDNYLAAMLSRRLGVPMPEETRRLRGGPTSEIGQAAGVLAGTEAARAKLQRAIMLGGDAAPEAADQSLPPPVQMTALEELPPPGDIKVEPIAAHVPAECLYLRFGSFTNYQWFRTRLDEWGGDLRNLISARSVNYNMNAKLERQIWLHETALSALLGPTVIADVALIGDDTFFREGAAFGMLFQARNNFGLTSDINRQRSEALKNEAGCTEKTIEIAGHKVSFISTPDNRIRSFYAVDGDFHFVATSQALVERFFAAGAGKNALAAAPDFRLARKILPLDRDDTVFAFLSEEFFRNLASPSYQIEMNRRLRSVTEIDLAEMARLAAQAEGVQATTLEQLVAGEYLPKSMLQRPDGSRLVFEQDGSVWDSLRGPEGSFLPVPDMPIKGVTRSEAVEYQRFAESFQNQLGRMDPIVVAVKQLGIENDRERVEIAGRMLPLAARHYSLAMRLLGPADKQRLAPVPSDLATLEGVVSGNILALVQSFIPGIAAQQPGEPYHAAIGVRNIEAPYDVRDGQVKYRAGLLQSVPFYIAAWPNPGMLGLLGLGRADVPRDQEGIARTALMWDRQLGPITVAAPRRDVLADISPQLKIVDAARPGQIWLHVSDVTQSKLSNFSNSLGYTRARNITLGNTHFLHLLTTQLGVAPEQALAVAEELLEAKLVSPVGGHYELVKPEGRFPFWTSTALSNERRGGPLGGVPDGFRSPPLDWFRGLEAELSVEQGRLSLDAQVLMQRGLPKVAK
jgi:hypothetical protein